jgi:hypothetical protein
MKLKQKIIIIFIILIIFTINVSCTITRKNETKLTNQSNTNHINLKQSKEEIDPEPTVESISYDDYIKSLRDSMRTPLDNAIEYDGRITKHYIEKLYNTKLISKEDIKIYEVRAPKTCSFNDNLKIKVGGVFKICDLKGEKEIINVIPFTENATNINNLKWEETYTKVTSLCPNNTIIRTRGIFNNEIIQTKKIGINLGRFFFGVHHSRTLYNVSEPFMVSVPFDSSNM